MIHRAVNVPLSKYNFDKEINTIKYIAQRNNIHIDVDKIAKKKIQAIFRNSISNLSPSHIENRNKWIKIPFMGNISYKISKVIRRIGYKPAYYTLYN